MRKSKDNKLTEYAENPIKSRQKKLCPTRTRDCTMKRYKCPDCGNEFIEGNVPDECPTCGCPSDIIQSNEIIDVAQNVKYCPQCGSVLPSRPIRFCPDCGSELSSQKLQDIDIICPDCNTVITNINADCPICGCPSNMFVQRAKTKFVKGELLECPDCGQVFTEIIPADCPNCGCPSDKFKKHKEEKVPQDAYTQKDSSSLTILIIFIIGIISGTVYFAYNRSQEAKEQARQEQYQKEQQAKKEREEREREAAKQRQERELQRQKEQMMKVVVGTWRSETIRTRSGYCSMYLYFYSSRKFECKLYDNYTGYCLDRQSGTFSVVPESGGGSAGIVLNPNTSNSSWIDYKEGSFSDHLYFGGYSFTKSSY